MAFELRNTAWVDEQGSYGVGEIIMFDDDDLTQEQWELLQNLHDGDRLPYINAIMAGEPLNKWEDE